MAAAAQRAAQLPLLAAQLPLLAAQLPLLAVQLPLLAAQLPLLAAQLPLLAALRAAVPRLGGQPLREEQAQAWAPLAALKAT